MIKTGCGDCRIDAGYVGIKVGLGKMFSNFPLYNAILIILPIANAP